MPGEVVFVRSYTAKFEQYVFVAYWQDGHGYDSTTYLVAGKTLEVIPAAQPGQFHCPGRVASGPGSRPVCGFDDWDHDPHDYGHAADPTGQLYSRADDETTQAIGAREPLHTGAVTEAGLVDETPECPSAWHVNDSERTRCPICGEAD